MNKKIFIEGLLLISTIIILWFGLSRIDYMSLFKIKHQTENLEKKLGDVIWKNIQLNQGVILNDKLVKTLDSLIVPICKANKIDRNDLKVHLVNKDETNAFALPDGHLIIYTGLILDCKKQEALQGVIGHEIAHIKNKHVMKKLSKEIGFVVLSNLISGGNSSSSGVGMILNKLSSTAYDRKLEKEADIESVNYLLKAKIDPKPFADFMYQLSKQSESPIGFEWISTHPESEERAKYILEYIKSKDGDYRQTLKKENWENFKKDIRNYYE
jgi:predicted Zn-dependent protease